MSKNWIRTFTGKKFCPFDPQPEDICIEDIAHALSNICRFTGHCSSFYSVDEHSRNVSLLCSSENKLWGLLHDSPEAYIFDMASPIKHGTDIGVMYQELEKKIMDCVCDTFNLTKEEPAEVKLADLAMLYLEGTQLLPHGDWNDFKQYADKFKFLPDYISCYSPNVAKEVFMVQYYAILNQ